MTGPDPVATWLPAWRPDGPLAPCRLICLPYAGGSPVMYRAWEPALAGVAEVLATCPPGRLHRWRERPQSNLHQLADELTEVIAVLPDRPLALFGYSLGALIGLEVARRLADRGRPPALFIAAACPAPGSITRDRAVHLLPDDEFAAVLKRLGVTPQSLLQNEEMMRVLLPMLRMDFAMSERYAYRPSRVLPTPIVTMAGRQDPDAGPGDMAGWAAETGHLRHICLDGGHMFIDTEEETLLMHVSDLLREMVALDRLGATVPERGPR
jgi:medium-chain acyl-[acyl-carrier-protein] hydrolase